MMGDGNLTPQFLRIKVILHREKPPNVGGVGGSAWDATPEWETEPKMRASITRRIISPVQKREFPHARARVRKPLTGFSGEREKAGKAYFRPFRIAGAPRILILPTRDSSRNALALSEVSTQT